MPTWPHPSPLLAVLAPLLVSLLGLPASAVAATEAAVVAAAADPAAAAAPTGNAADAPGAPWRGTVVGRADVRHSVSGRAGQRLTVQLRASHPGLAVNVMPQGATEAMFIGSSAGRQVVLRLPADGRYELLVYLVRSAARRSEHAAFTLTATVGGTALVPLPAAQDALVAGTPYHATAELACQALAAPPGGRCSAGVRRYGRDGTATVVVQGAQGPLRRLLFEHGQLSASDSAQPARLQRDGGGRLTVLIGSDERYELDEALLTGG